MLKSLVKAVLRYRRAYIVSHFFHNGMTVLHAYAVSDSFKHFLVVHAVAEADSLRDILSQKFAELAYSDTLVEIKSEYLTVKTAYSFKILYAEYEMIFQKLHRLVKLTRFRTHEYYLINVCAVVFTHRADI